MTLTSVKNGVTPNNAVAVMSYVTLTSPLKLTIVVSLVSQKSVGTLTRVAHFDQCSDECSSPAYRCDFIDCSDSA